MSAGFSVRDQKDLEKDRKWEMTRKKGQKNYPKWEKVLKKEVK
jgi:hypothetical protein